MRAFAYIIGIIFLVFGICGFVPSLVVNGRLWTIFYVNDWLNSLHVISGGLAILAGISKKTLIRLYFQIFGVIYAVVAALGFVYGNKDILGFLANNGPDTWFHTILAIACLILGYGSRD